MSRRAVLAGALGGMTAAASRVLRAGADDPPAAPRLIIRSFRPLDAETPVEVFDSQFTPNPLFFVRSHFGAPAVVGPWRLAVRGAVERTLNLGMGDLERLERVTVPALLQCSGNGRAFFEPSIPGVAWERGAVGNALWSGVRLKDVLDKAGIKRGAAHVHLHGADAPPMPKTPLFLRSIPLGRALESSTLVATHMNGEPLPIAHGGPMRLVVPTWAGNHWIKWLRTIVVDAAEAPGFYMEKGYRLPRKPYPPGVEPPATELEPVTTLNVKSLISRPSRGATVRGGQVDVQGVAWTGAGTVAKVEVAIDGSSWRMAELIDAATEGSWRRWRFAASAGPGLHGIAVRATDSLGKSQPEVTPWNKSGYLWNGIDSVRFEMRGKA
jgi:DMSO/TMAO reductase YedYZ molybdopterin-dependent catalytic subunit